MLERDKNLPFPIIIYDVNKKTQKKQCKNIVMKKK